jgi:predicted aminopeptidase
MTGCNTVRFYTQAFRGQFQIFSQQQPAGELISDPDTPERLQQRLRLVQELRVFARNELHLPVDNHYRNYVELDRPFVVWNVQAARPYSLEPKRWWYPIVGGLEYRGYFSEAAAKRYARRLASKGYEVSVGGVDAYSTLGWFKDPILSTFVFHDDADLAELIFHELAHQRVFARGDTDFNEAFATTVGQEGARRWLRQEGVATNLHEAYLVSLQRNAEFVGIVLRARSALEQVYGDRRDEDGNMVAAKRPVAPREVLEARKQAVFAQLQADYAALKEQWGGDNRYDAWFARPLNNARLNTIANYYDYLPGFQALLELKHGDLEAFYEAAERLAHMPREERHQWLRNLSDTTKSPPETHPIAHGTQAGFRHSR